MQILSFFPFCDIDDVLGFSYEAMNVPLAVTANLSVNYITPLPAQTKVLVHVTLEQQINRKLYFHATITNVDSTITYTNASCLYIIPRHVWDEQQQQQLKQ